MRDDWERMSDTESANGRKVDAIPEGGILASLPRTRPQRATPRRAAARSTASKSTSNVTSAKTSRGKVTGVAPMGGPVDKTSKAKRSTGTGSTGTRATKTTGPNHKPPVRKSSPKPPEPPAPKQGYEPEEEVELGATVHPPSGVELVESVADILGELAGTGLTAGGRLLKDAFSIFRRP